jgi:DDE superfamily endonuclease
VRYQSTTGLDNGQIEELVGRIEQIVGVGKRGSGRPAVVDLYGQVVMVLVLLRQNLNQMAVADMFGVSQPTVSRIYRTVLPLLEQVTCLHKPDFAAGLAGRVVLVDGTDVLTGNRREGRDNYSGKRHRQGLNIQVCATDDGTLLAVSDPVPGCRHDRRAITEVGWEDLLAGHHWIADPAYIGTTAITPEKKPQNGELSPRTKENNKTISGIRSAVERCIAHLKNWKILATGYRGRLGELPNIIRIVTRIEFYRLGW